MAIHGAGLKLGMKLTAKEPGMLFKLDNLYQTSVRRKPAQNHAVAAQEFAVVVVEFIAGAGGLGKLFFFLQNLIQNTPPPPHSLFFFSFFYKK